MVDLVEIWEHFAELLYRQITKLFCEGSKYENVQISLLFLGALLYFCISCIPPWFFIISDHKDRISFELQCTLRMRWKTPYKRFSHMHSMKVERPNLFYSS